MCAGDLESSGKRIKKMSSKEESPGSLVCTLNYYLSVNTNLYLIIYNIDPCVCA